MSLVTGRGAVPRVPAVRRRALALVRSFTSPLLPDDYLELINPLWSTRELRGRVERIERASADAVTVLIKPGWEWPGHLPGQYLRLGIEVDGRHHWRAYSLTSEPGRADGCISITPKLVPSGAVSPFLCQRLRPGAIVRLGGVEGAFTLPDPVPARLLFLSAGSGITPIVSMLRSLAARGALEDVVHLHSTRTPEQFAFALNHVADRDADPEAHLAARRIGHVPGAQAFLDVDRAAHGLDCARKFGEHGIARGVENPAAALGDEIVGHQPIGGEPPQRFLFVLGNQSAVSGNIGRKNRRDLAFHESEPRTTICRRRMPLEVPERNHSVIKRSG